MNSVERVRNAIHLKPVDRVPLDFWFGRTDLHYIFPKPPETWKPKRFAPYYRDYDVLTGIDEKDQYTKREDEWGTIWGFGTVTGDVGEPVEYPLKTIEDLKHYEFPDPEDPSRFRSLADEIEKNSNKYIAFCNQFFLFERLHLLNGFDQALMNLAMYRKEMEDFLDRLVDWNVKLVQAMKKNLGDKVHGYVTTDDWGTQNTTFISPQLWREVFKPRYKKVIDVVHENGYDCWLHSDGRIEVIIPDMIEIGVEVFQFPQPSSIRDIKEFGQEFAGKAAFALYIDIQTTAPEGNLQKVRQEATDLVDYWSNDFCSGIVATDYPDPVSCNINQQTRETALEAFNKAFDDKLKRHSIKTSA